MVFSEQFDVVEMTIADSHTAYRAGGPTFRQLGRAYFDRIAANLKKERRDRLDTVIAEDPDGFASEVIKATAKRKRELILEAAKAGKLTGYLPPGLRVLAAKGEVSS